MEEQINWLELELAELNQSKPQMEQLEGLKMEENKLYEIEVDVSKPWER